MQFNTDYKENKTSRKTKFCSQRVSHSMNITFKKCFNLLVKIYHNIKLVKAPVFNFL